MNNILLERLNEGDDNILMLAFKFLWFKNQKSKKWAAYHKHFSKQICFIDYRLDDMDESADFDIDEFTGMPDRVNRRLAKWWDSLNEAGVNTKLILTDLCLYLVNHKFFDVMDDLEILGREIGVAREICEKLKLGETVKRNIENTDQICTKMTFELDSFLSNGKYDLVFDTVELGGDK